MRKKQKIWLCLGLMVILLIGVFILYRATKKLTYIEYEKLGTNCESTLEMNNNDFTIEQEFKIPYQMFQGISLSIGTYGRENNSRYEAIIMDKTTNQQMASFEFNTSQVKDNEAYRLLLNFPKQVDNTHLFSVIIKAKTRVNGENGVAFYADKNVENNENLFYNGNVYHADLCMEIFGGNPNNFWFLLTLGWELFVLVLLGYIIYLAIHKKSIKKNALVEAGLLGIAIFAILATFSRMETFGDEVDNMIGGMLISKGHILYVDYYTQHTPLMYFLCAVFSLLQAGSVQQFRLLYYGLMTIAYMGLYLRHKDNFGKMKMALLPIAQIMFGLMIGKETLMVLSDNIQAICMVALLLEFLQYLKDEKLDWKRSMIVSVSIFGSFMAAFVSVYAIFAICVGVFIKEILYWKQQKFVSFRNLLMRYWKLMITCLIPFMVWFIYLLATHSLGEFYEQAFQFNTQVYSYYLEGGFGSNILQPFFIGITNFVQIIPNAVGNIMENQEVIVSFVNVILGIYLFGVLLYLWRKKKYLKTVILFLFISFGFTRTNEKFHAIATWSSILTIILLHTNFDKLRSTQRTVFKVILMIMIIFVLGNYCNHLTLYLFKQKQTITALDQMVISKTNDGEEIFYDIYSHSSVYLIYKNRLPMNRLGFILPWYMDWYELDAIDDLISKKPKLVIYDEDLKAWEISGYDDYLRKFLHENYKQTEKNRKIWVLK